MSAIPYSITENDGLRFSFESVSSTRMVQKIILYDQITEAGNLYSLALLDRYEDGSVDDLSVSNNQDMPRVLATVIHTMHLFFQQFPIATVVFSGSTPARTRLYRVAISQNITLFDEIFLVKEVLNGNPELYRPNKAYDAFTIRLKTNSADENSPESDSCTPPSEA